MIGTTILLYGLIMLIWGYTLTQRLKKNIEVLNNGLYMSIYTKEAPTLNFCLAILATLILNQAVYFGIHVNLFLEAVYLLEGAIITCIFIAFSVID